MCGKQGRSGLRAGLPGKLVAAGQAAHQILLSRLASSGKDVALPSKGSSPPQPSMTWVHSGKAAGTTGSAFSSGNCSGGVGGGCGVRRVQEEGRGRVEQHMQGSCSVHQQTRCVRSQATSTCYASLPHPVSLPNSQPTWVERGRSAASSRQKNRHCSKQAWEGNEDNPGQRSTR